jgi:hypothetical protein
MIECIFTIDYEIYGNGEGSLRELVYDPTEKLMATFRKWNVPFVMFVEVAELEMIDVKRTDPAIDLVKSQIRDLHRAGFEIGLHLHPQWYNGRHENGRWLLDYNEYNLCTLKRERIIKIVDRSIAYLRDVLCESGYTPFAFRAGNWLFQPSGTTATVLKERGIKVDSSVFKGGLQRQHKLDYRRALKNGYYWSFTNKVDVPDARGALLELPIYTKMVPFWKMTTKKRLGMQRKNILPSMNSYHKLNHLLDYLRLWYPLKLDFCRMTIGELTSIMERIIKDDQKSAHSYKPLVVIGHTKDLVDFETVELFLSYLNKNRILASTFKEVYKNCQ